MTLYLHGEEILMGNLVMVLPMVEIPRVLFYPCVNYQLALQKFSKPVQDEMIVFPNPSSNGTFQLINAGTAKSGPVTMEIHNVLGEIIFRLNNVTITNAIIDISNQPDGVYFMTVLSGGRRTSQKLITQ